MDVLDDHDDRALCPQGLEQVEPGLEEPCLSCVPPETDHVTACRSTDQVVERPKWSGAVGIDVGFERDPCPELAEQLANRRERNRRTRELDAPTDACQGAAATSHADRLVDEPGLPDAGLAADEQELTVARCCGVDGGRDPPEFGRPADEERA